jgi:hypothetical protein
MDANRKPISVVLASAYAPIGAAKESIRQDFATQLERCFDAPKSDQVLLMELMPMRQSRSMGLRSDNRDLVLGPFGVNHINDAGRELHDLLSAKGMYFAASFFQKPAHAS